jgi:hypothetical protein
MSASSYYWSRSLVPGFGKMWFLIALQDANSSGGGVSLLGSVVNEISGFPLGSNYPEPFHLTTPQLILDFMEANRAAIGFPPGQKLIQEQTFASLSIQVDKRRTLKAGVDNFPGVPASLSVDYSRMSKITIDFGSNTRRLFIPVGYLSQLKSFCGGDDTKIPSPGVNIDKETIVHQLLLSDQYSVTFESTDEFDATVQAAINQQNTTAAGKVSFAIDTSTKKKIIATVSGGGEYLLAIKDIDWDDL